MSTLRTWPFGHLPRRCQKAAEASVAAAGSALLQGLGGGPISPTDSVPGAQDTCGSHTDVWLCFKIRGSEFPGSPVADSSLLLRDRVDLWLGS